MWRSIRRFLKTVSTGEWTKGIYSSIPVKLYTNSINMDDTPLISSPQRPSSTREPCVACGADDSSIWFVDAVSRDTVCMCCGHVSRTDSNWDEGSSHGPDHSAANTCAAVSTVSPDPVMLREPVSAGDKVLYGCTYRMFDQPFDVMAKKCELMEGLYNRRSLIAMRSACERVGVTRPEFTLTHDPSVQAVAAYVVATHTPGVNRGRTRLLKEPQEQTGLPHICETLGVTINAVAKCVRTYGDDLYNAMRQARRIGILPRLENNITTTKSVRSSRKRRV